jgi:hypothetical protein
MLTIPRKTLASNILLLQLAIGSQQKFLEDESMANGESLACDRSFQHCFDLVSHLTDQEYQALSNRIKRCRLQRLKASATAVACILLFHIAAVSQPVFSDLTDADFKPPAETFDTLISVTTLPSLVRFSQVSKIWDTKTEIYFQVFFQPKPCGELQHLRNGICRPISLSLPIRSAGLYYVQMKGKDGKKAKARIEVKPSDHLVTATAKFWQL